MNLIYGFTIKSLILNNLMQSITDFFLQMAASSSCSSNRHCLIFLFFSFHLTASQIRPTLQNPFWKKKYDVKRLFFSHPINNHLLSLDDPFSVNFKEDVDSSDSFVIAHTSLEQAAFFSQFSRRIQRAKHSPSVEGLKN